MIPRAAVAAALLLAGCAMPGPRPDAAAPAGYLSPGDIDRLGRMVARAPAAAEAEAAALSLFGAVPPGTDRWWLATAHAELRPPWAAQHFDCALGTRLAERPRPALTRLMARLAADAAAAARAGGGGDPGPPRPFARVAGLEPCERVPAGVRNGPSRPAVGAIVAGAYGELFAALAPDAGAAARRTAREIGWSRAVCRMNWPADVEDGLAAGAAVYAAAAARPAFTPDLEAARGELAAARAEGLSSPACAAERRALRQWRAPPAPGGQAGRGATSEP